jgi:quinol monooxygenase YgiN
VVRAQPLQSQVSLELRPFQANFWLLNVGALEKIAPFMLREGTHGCATCNPASPNETGPKCHQVLKGDFMLIAHVYFSVAENDRQKALDTLIAEAPTVRAMAGCLAFMPFVDPTNSEGLGILHEWETDEAFGAYIASPGFAEAGRVLRPMMTGAPISRRFDAKLLQTVN